MRPTFLWQAAALTAAALSWQAAHASNQAVRAAASPRSDTVLQAAEELALHLLESADHRGLPFAIIDKPAARFLLYHGDGTLAGISPMLLGQDPGDHSIPGVGERAQHGRLRKGDRTTPAGRFVSQPGHNRSGEAIIWLDYASALAIHRLRPGPAREQRERRMASPESSDNRISAGCVVLPVAFYVAVVQPLLGRSEGIVYIVPEHSPWQDLWPELIRDAL